MSDLLVQDREQKVPTTTTTIATRGRERGEEDRDRESSQNRCGRAGAEERSPCRTESDLSSSDDRNRCGGTPDLQDGQGSPEEGILGRGEELWSRESGGTHRTATRAAAEEDTTDDLPDSLRLLQKTLLLLGHLHRDSWRGTCSSCGEEEEEVVRASRIQVPESRRIADEGHEDLGELCDGLSEEVCGGIRDPPHDGGQELRDDPPPLFADVFTVSVIIRISAVLEKLCEGRERVSSSSRSSGGRRRMPLLLLPLLLHLCLLSVEGSLAGCAPGDLELLEVQPENLETGEELPRLQLQRQPCLEGLEDRELGLWLQEKVPGEGLRDAASEQEETADIFLPLLLRRLFVPGERNPREKDRCIVEGEGGLQGFQDLQETLPMTGCEDVLLSTVRGLLRLSCEDSEDFTAAQEGSFCTEEDGERDE